MGKSKMSRFYQWLSKKSVVRQVTLIYSVIILVPALIIGIALIQTMYSSRIEEVDRSNRQYVQQMRRNILSNMDSTKSLARKIRFDTELQYYLYHGNQKRMEEIYNSYMPLHEKSFYFFNGWTGANQKMLDETYERKHKSALPEHLVNRQRIAYQKSVNGAKHSYQELLLHTTINLYSENYLIPEERESLIWLTDKVNAQPYYEHVALSNEVEFWGDVRKQHVLEDSEAQYKVMPSGDWVVPYYSRILQPTTGQYLGFLEFDMRLDRMAAIGSVLDGIEQNSAFTPTLLLYGRDGQLFYSSSMELSNDDVTLPRAAGAGVFTVRLNGTNYRLVYDTMDDIGLVIGSMVPDTVLLDQVLPAVLILVAALCAGMIIVMLLSRKIAANLFWRLTDLDNHIERVQQEGQFEQFQVDGEDEIARIASTFNLLMVRLSDMISDVVEKETAQRAAEMRALQAQINPHFLYNTLET